jgi:hypothetical protein
MNVGTLVKIREVCDERLFGTVLNRDVYYSSMGDSESIIEVLWNTGQKGWILVNRVTCIASSKCKPVNIMV